MYEVAVCFLKLDMSFQYSLDNYLYMRLTMFGPPNLMVLLSCLSVNHVKEKKKLFLRDQVIIFLGTVDLIKLEN